jgi:putative endonuclease
MISGFAVTGISPRLLLRWNILIELSIPCLCIFRHLDRSKAEWRDNLLRTVLYIGVTSNSVSRLEQHREKTVKGFTQKYKVDRLILLEEYTTMLEAIGREKQLKRWSRIKKERLIARSNPGWFDLDLLL